jgi:hypothetical protein
LIIKQMASMAARVGMWDSALSMSELAEFVDEHQQQMKAIGIPTHEVEEALQKVYQRIEAAYYAMARHEVATAVNEAFRRHTRRFRFRRRGETQKGDFVGNGPEQRNAACINPAGVHGRVRPVCSGLENH